MKKLNQIYLKKLLTSRCPYFTTSLMRSMLVVGLVFVSRFGFLPANFSPVGTLGFFSKSLWPLMLVTLGFDLLRGGHYPGFLWTYDGFLMYWLMGLVARKTTLFGSRDGRGGVIKRQLFLLPMASLLFFLLSNFGVWLNWYPRTVEGLVTCYTLALPFYRNTLMGDVAFGGIVLVVKLVLNQKFNFIAFVSTLKIACQNKLS
ncbi:MAG: DUF6580 family putative transport protein [Patescibacteria group bacterium]